MKIVLLDGHASNLDISSWQPIEEFGLFTTYDRTAPADVVARAAEADVIITNKVTIDADILAHLPKLKLICVLATGYNTIDAAACKAHGVTVCNVPAYSTDSVAQMVFAHILNYINRVDYYANINRNGRWCSSPDFCYWDTPSHELSGMTLGIVGLGNIGTKVAKIAHAFGMDIFALTSKPSSSLPEYIQKATLESLLSVSDIITLHCPLAANTHEMINATTLQMVKHGALLVNTGRGPLVDETAVADALKSGLLGGYAADVMCQEPPSKDNPLLSLPNAFITPHLAWATVEARTRLLQATLDNIRAFVGGHPQNVVNA